MLVKKLSYHIIKQLTVGGIRYEFFPAWGGGSLV